MLMPNSCSCVLIISYEQLKSNRLYKGMCAPLKVEYLQIILPFKIYASSALVYGRPLANTNCVPTVQCLAKRALRTILRQDPNIILLGEIRDRETAEIAIQSGQTGHYVLSTIHTIDAIEVITRLRKMGISDYDIASTLATSVSQRLVRRFCNVYDIKRIP